MPAPLVLRVKRDRYYMVIGYKNSDGEWKQKWKSTGLVIRGNKKRAEAMLKKYNGEIQKSIVSAISFQKSTGKTINIDDTVSLITFADFIINWLQQHKKHIQPSTYLSYYRIVTNEIVPYFEVQGTLLCDLNQNHISDYYNTLYERGLKPNSVKKYHANIRKSLDFAFKRDMIVNNPADKVDLARVEKYKATYYSDEELGVLFDKLTEDSHWLEDIVMITAFYGLRLLEVIGLIWDNIDFENKIINIAHTATLGLDKNNKTYLDLSNDTKTESSNRKLRLIDKIEKILIEKKNNNNFIAKFVVTLIIRIF